MADFMADLKNMLDRVQNNVSVTENGAIGYKTTGKALLDLNFKLSSMRNWDDDKIWTEFLAAYNETPQLASVWLFFARDARSGSGERRVFRVIFPRLAQENSNMAIQLLQLIPEYGRWDDVVDVAFSCAPCKVRDEAMNLISKQIRSDILCANTDQPVSLLGKWMPSLNTSSKETRRRAETLRVMLRWTPKQYRKNMAELRKRIKVVEQQMSAKKWSEINYEGVPSKAGLLYRSAFSRHDGDRYQEYLTNVKEGKAKMHADVIFPYEIVHAYMSDDWEEEVRSDLDETLELKWQNLPNTVKDGEGTLVVVDGSGSMETPVGGTSVTCSDVARSLGIYFAERLTGAFKNSFITFSAEPKLVRFNGINTLQGKIKVLCREQDCSNTNIEKTFDLILRTAVENHMKQDELPKNVLIVSDMEFDAATRSYSWGYGTTSTVSKSLFDEIALRWENAGYKLPRLVFWNVCSRSETIPMTKNDMGVALVSGFSPNIADMVMSGKLDPWEVLVDKLLSDRYESVRKVVMPF